jgi:hypothetical protein
MASPRPAPWNPRVVGKKFFANAILTGFKDQFILLPENVRLFLGQKIVIGFSDQFLST